MVARINTVAFHGIDVQSVDVEVQISGAGLPAFNIVGLPDKAVAESKERVRGALHALGISLPPKRLTVNLAPADIAKEGSHFDLPIALGVLAALEILPKEEMENCLVLGELSLDGSIRAVAGVLPAAMHAFANENKLICPKSCGAEAAWAGDIDILAPGDLLQLINHIKGTQILNRPQAQLLKSGLAYKGTDISYVRGQESAKRALLIAAAGGHNMLMCGPPGSGKSMLASCLPGILPPLSPREALETSMVHSLAGTLPEGGLMHQRPFRDPHHSASLPALVGGGQKAKPGEISLAHNGVLFLDELPEFARATLEALRQPLESGRTLIARANHHVTYPARFQLIAAMNPCRCGYMGDPGQQCTRAPVCGNEYQNKISGPMMDRIDLQLDVPPVSIADISAPPESGTARGDTSAQMATKVIQAREIQRIRFAQQSRNSQGTNTEIINATCTPAMLETIAPLDDDARLLLAKAAEAMKLSARAYHRILRVARTIADLEGDEGTLTRHHLAEALSYRRRIHGNA